MSLEEIKPIRKNIYWHIFKNYSINVSKKITPKKLRQLFRDGIRRTKYHIIGLFKNKHVYCPIEQQEYNFFPSKASLKSGARARYRLFWLFLERETSILNEGTSILHCAPQLGILRRLQSYPNLDYVPADKKLPGYDYANETIDVDLLDIPFEKERFDFILCNRVLEHIEDDFQAMAEMYRVLKLGGKAIITVPINFNQKETHESYTSLYDRIKYYGQWDHVRMYSGDIKDRLESAGFKVEIVEYSKQFSKKEFKLFGLVKDFIIIAQK